MTLPNYVIILSVLLAVLLVVRWVGAEMKPIFTGIIAGLAQQARVNSATFAIAIGFGLAASCSAFIDVFQTLSREQAVALSGHQYAVLWVKVFNPFVVSVLAYATQSKIKGSGGTNAGTTQAPFPPSNP